ncbi:MAG: hypothetical protein P4L47_23590 [Mucilaginibacter sp.]|nr:hypothetical protein [Mucilaginibacter sp.]
MDAAVVAVVAVNGCAAIVWDGACGDGDACGKAIAAVAVAVFFPVKLWIQL